MLLASGHNHAAPEPSTIRMLWEPQKKHGTDGTDGSRETLCQIIIRGKSVLYFKRTGKVKNKLPVGGRP